MEQTCETCGVSISGGDVLYTTTAKRVCPACFAKAAPAPAAAKPGLPALIVGAIAVVLPMFVTISSSSSVTINGHVESSVYRNWPAVAFGIVAILCAAVAMVAAVRARAGLFIGLAALVIVFGGAQVANGFGMFQPAPATDDVVSFQITTPEPAADTPATCKDGTRCFELAQSLDGAPKQAAFMRACDLKAAGGCIYAGRALAKTDPTAAAQLYQRGCDLGGNVGCFQLAESYLNGTGVTKDVARARALFVTSCEKANAEGCAFASDLFEEAKDRPRATELALKACELDPKEQPAACNSAGVFLNEADPKANAKQVVALFEQACEARPALCKNLGVVFADGLAGTKQDLVRARTLYTKACDAGSAMGCNNLGSMWRHGDGGAKDPVKAKALFKQACDAGEKLGCTNLAK
ncbi:MAG: tetratricopeptide repeat protein [Kofleriaceae bacterium]